jgi:hypothetical protein
LDAVLIYSPAGNERLGPFGEEPVAVKPPISPALLRE